MIRRKRVLIAGGGGSIGSELVRQLSKSNKVFIIDIDETNAFDLAEALELEGRWVHSRIGDICEKETVEDVFSDFRPHVVINAAARKHVKPNEDYPIEAVRTNILGLHNLLQATRRWPVQRFVQISTDKAVNARSIMGATKLLGEVMVRNRGGIVVRFGNVMGSRGSVIPFWQGQLDRGEAVTVTDERMERYFMSIEEACRLVIEAAEVGRRGETLILEMGRHVNVLELAKEIVARTGRGDIRMIGMRPGETLSEKLMSVEEEARAIKRGRFHVIPAL